MQAKFIGIFELKNVIKISKQDKEIKVCCCMLEPKAEMWSLENIATEPQKHFQVEVPVSWNLSIMATEFLSHCSKT